MDEASRFASLTEDVNKKIPNGFVDSNAIKLQTFIFVYNKTVYKVLS